MWLVSDGNGGVDLAEQQEVRVQMRRRLMGLGAVVAISLAITPLLFDAAGYRERQLENRIPPAPELSPPVEITPIYPRIEEPVEPVTIEPAPEVAPPSESVAAAIKDDRPEVLPSEDTPSLDSRGIPVAWTLQLASFKDEQNAKALRADLNKAGYKVYIQHSSDLVRVFIGPDMQRSRLEQLQDTIKRDYSLDGMIVRFSTD